MDAVALSPSLEAQATGALMEGETIPAFVARAIDAEVAARATKGFVWPLVFPLAKPVPDPRNNDMEARSISLMEPGAGHLIKHAILDTDVLSAAQVVALIADLSLLPPSSVEAMSVPDFMKLRGKLVRFLQQAAR